MGKVNDGQAVGGVRANAPTPFGNGHPGYLRLKPKRYPVQKVQRHPVAVRDMTVPDVESWFEPYIHRG